MLSKKTQVKSRLPSLQWSETGNILEVIKPGLCQACNKKAFMAELIFPGKCCTFLLYKMLYKMLGALFYL